jgi:hypothetical protein
MEKRQATLIFLLIILFSLVLYLIFTSESIKETDNTTQSVKQDNSAALEFAYKLKAKKLLKSFDYLVNNNLTEQNIAELRNNSLALTGVPKKFQNLHAQFVIALDKMKNYFSQNIETEKNSSLEIINQLKADYTWLND